ncbi:hypothetical protein RchiOBHm_Chr2g0110131 [Rosa chinensis]|uniref:Uncharacterized protein n=1 Tax=Rosa chinensis TaxID=74649 RepID=A0A2P6RPM4_ROSCH|nr:hypothetical protein RchiOBHm_Chr2g0110131 [Rosa chinensis]
MHHVKVVTYQVVFPIRKLIKYTFLLPIMLLFLQRIIIRFLHPNHLPSLQIFQLVLYKNII